MWRAVFCQVSSVLCCLIVSSTLAQFWVSMCFLDSAAAAKSLQSCLTLCDPIDGSPPVSPVPGILQARTLEWVAPSPLYPREWFCHLMSDLAAKTAAKSLSHVRLCATPYTAAHQAPPSMRFSRQKYWSELPCPSPMHGSEK